MKWFAILVLALAQSLYAIPNQVSRAVNQADSPLNGLEVGNQLLSAALWQGEQGLPGNWRKENEIAGAQTSHLLARPKLFDLDVMLLRATHRKNSLESVTATFVDAGSYFPYLTKKPDVPIDIQRQGLLNKQVEFKKLYSETFKKLKNHLVKRSEGKVKESHWGRSRKLRADILVYDLGVVRAVLYTENGRLLRLTLTRDRDLYRKGWLDKNRLSLLGNDLTRYYQNQVMQSEDGDYLIQGVHTVPQGYKPYCGLNSLTMVAQYFGLHIDEDWMAVAGGFQNTGSAPGSSMLGLYNATAREASLSLSREVKFIRSKARSLIKSGLPVVVWRRFDFKRNLTHVKFARSHARNNSLILPLPDEADRATWPGGDHPVHASVIIGFNDERKEVIYLESWAGQSIPRRMRYEEIEATATMVFYFEGK